jgi:hypothetical protein
MFLLSRNDEYPQIVNLIIWIPQQIITQNKARLNLAFPEEGINDF